MACLAQQLLLTIDNQLWPTFTKIRTLAQLYKHKQHRVLSAAWCSDACYVPLQGRCQLYEEWYYQIYSSCTSSPSVLACMQYCLPTDSPHLARHAKPLAMAMSPLLWGRHKPDLFDSYSLGAHVGSALNLFSPDDALISLSRPLHGLPAAYRPLLPDIRVPMSRHMDRQAN